MTICTSIPTKSTMLISNMIFILRYLKYFSKVALLFKADDLTLFQLCTPIRVSDGHSPARNSELMSAVPSFGFSISLL